MSTNENILELYPATTEFIGILSIPHSGEIVPKELKGYLIHENWHLMQDVDYRVHELIDITALQNAGITVLKSNIIRTAVDLNRSRELALLNWKKNSKDVEIVISEPKPEIAESLLGLFYDPYYEMLNTLIYELGSKRETPSLVDLHSMPGVAEEYHLKINPNQTKIRPDFCLSDVNGETCTQEFIQFISNDLAKDYENVTINSPYFGGHVTRYLNQKHKRLNNIQIEISRSLYMNEENKELKNNSDLKNNLTRSLINLFNQF